MNSDAVGIYIYIYIYAYAYACCGVIILPSWPVRGVTIRAKFVV